jgi:hypothetical protein
MSTRLNPPQIVIIAYLAVNEIQQLTDRGERISRYGRSFRYENQDPLVSRQMAFNKLMDEKQGRLFDFGGDPMELFGACH